MKNIIIIGAGEQGRVVQEYIHHIPEYTAAGYLDDMSKQKSINGLPLLGTIKDHKYENKNSYVVALGDNPLRGKIMQSINDNSLETIIHPTAIIAKTANIGTGSIIGPGVIICNETNIGKGVLIDSGAIIEHDNNIGDYVNISPGAITAGGVSIGDYTWIGLGAKIGEDLTIGKHSLMGMGAVVTKNMPDNIVAYGVPAIIKTKM